MKKDSVKTDLDIDFGSHLKSLRNAVGLSQGDVGKKLGYTSPQFVSNWERGLSEPPVETLAKLAALYKTSLEALVENYIKFRVQGLERDIRAKIPNVHIKRQG